MRNGRSFKLICAAVMMLAMLLLASCDTFDSFRNTFIGGISGDDNVIKIGVYEPQTGKYSDKGLEEIKGIELANSVYNSVDGYRVELVKVDTHSTTNAAETAVQGLIKMKPVAIIGSSSESESLLASKYVKKAKIPTITPSAKNPLITQNCEFYFRASITNTQMGAGVAEYVKDALGTSNMAIVTMKNDTVATALIDGFNDKLKSMSVEKGNVVKMQTEVAGNEDFSKTIKEMKEKNIDTAFVPMGVSYMDDFFKKVEKAGLTNVVFLGTESWGTEEFVSMLGKHPDITVAFPYASALNKNRSTSETITEEAQKFQIQFANMYGSNDTPTDNAALGYDSYLLLINAIHRAGSVKGKDVRNALAALQNVKCATGEFNFDETGDTRRKINISSIRDGKIISVYMTPDYVSSKVIEVK